MRIDNYSDKNYTANRESQTYQVKINEITIINGDKNKRKSKLERISSIIHDNLIYDSNVKIED